MSQATARLTLGSLFGTVVSAADAATGALGTVSNAVGMLNAYVANAAEEQQARFINEKATFIIRLVDEGTQAEAEVHLNALTFRKKSADHAELYDAAYGKYAALHGLKIRGDAQLHVAAE